MALVSSYSCARPLLAVVAAVTLFACGQTVQLTQPLDAGPYSVCSGPGLGAVDAATVGTPCQEQTNCQQVGAYFPFGSDQNGICTRICSTVQECPSLPNWQTVCDGPAGFNDIPRRCQVLCNDGGCPTGLTCVGPLCRPPR